MATPINAAPNALVFAPAGPNGLSWVGTSPAPPISPAGLGAALEDLFTPLKAPGSGTLDLTRLAKIADEADSRRAPLEAPLAALLDKNRPEGETGGLKSFDDIVGLLYKRYKPDTRYFGLGAVEPREILAACVLLAASILGEPLWTLFGAASTLERDARIGHCKDAPASVGELRGWLRWLVDLAFGGYLSMAGTLGTARLAERAGYADIAEQLRGINRDGLDGWTRAPDTPAGDVVNADGDDLEEYFRCLNVYEREAIVVPDLPPKTVSISLAPAQLSPAEPAPAGPIPASGWLSALVARAFGCAARR